MCVCVCVCVRLCVYMCVSVKDAFVLHEYGDVRARVCACTRTYLQGGKLHVQVLLVGGLGPRVDFGPMVVDEANQLFLLVPTATATTTSVVFFVVIFVLAVRLVAPVAKFGQRGGGVPAPPVLFVLLFVGQQRPSGLVHFEGRVDLFKWCVQRQLTNKSTIYKEGVPGNCMTQQKGRLNKNKNSNNKNNKRKQPKLRREVVSPWT